VLSFENERASSLWSWQKSVGNTAVLKGQRFSMMGFWDSWDGLLGQLASLLAKGFLLNGAVGLGVSDVASF
jgi:hypothetical protein